MLLVMNMTGFVKSDLASTVIPKGRIHNFPLNEPASTGETTKTNIVSVLVFVP